jgi:hypothetical protein
MMAVRSNDRPTVASARLVAPALLLACAQLLGCAAAVDAHADAAGAPAHVRVLGTGLKPPAPALPAIVDRSAGIELHSCADLLGVLRTGKDLGEAAELPQFNAYADCVAVALVAEGRGTGDGAFDLQHAGDRIYRDLDLATVASSLAPRRPAEHYRLRDLKFDAVTLTPLQAVLQGDGFSYLFEVLAIGDFRHLGRPELLVRFTDRATNQGTYDKRSVLVIDVAPQAPALLASDAMDVLRKHAP